ncbi:uncharacterized protein Z520_11712 [Fonsecaea multimorphosa CBS 102226]|uniref:3-hydroxyacyl-CoA dehydrogenase type-2 n=1 Tax=Fonsecaea multimorphosa CBS 102226 TaxID=1442371 RepID=A0A0D2I5I8_9EURO|nr:uncharacterized protein Z520_11712 [Fonsecaea multimorphosa CBS 102226]KIX92536.1 hypothetical protein Z520_11712 [Fonsecaea multimorphosa CBS 102226]
MKSAFEMTVVEFGAINVVVTCAGIMETKAFFDVPATDSQTDEPPEEPLETLRVVDVNLKGTIIALKLAFNFMRSNAPDPSTGSRGSIVFITSLSGYFGGTSVVGYVASKHGVVGLLRSAQKTAEVLGLPLNAIAPILTPIHITQSYTEKWMQRGLPYCTAWNVALPSHRWPKDTSK